MSALRVPGLWALAFVLFLGIAAIGPVAGVSAQITPGQQPGIVASGYGEASGPAESATVQVLLQSGAYGDMGYMGPMMTGDPAMGAGMAASPVPGEMMPPDMQMPMGPPALTEDDVAPVVDAIVAAGVAEEEIEVIVPSSSSMISGPGGPGGAQLRFSVPDPTLDGMRELAAAVGEAAGTASIGVMHIGVRYVGADCDALLREARDAAVANARERAEGLAASLGVGLGDLIQASDNPFYGPDGSDGCGQTPGGGYFGPYGEGIDPPFDAASPAEATAYSFVMLTYAMDSDDSATPTA